MLENLTQILKVTYVHYDKVNLLGKIGFLHSQVTASLLFLLCFIVSSQQYFGVPIQCVQDSVGDRTVIPERVINSFCFISTTYVRIEDKNLKSENNFRVQHSYYPWIPIVLFLQGLSFLLPQVFWTYQENGFLRKCLNEVKKTFILKDEYENSSMPIASYLSKRVNTLEGWALGSVFTELLLLINILANIVLTNVFLGGNFYQYGLQVIFAEKSEISRAYQENLFPKLTKCNFHKYGPSGTIENRDALCLMPLNIVNEKIYILLWIWFTVLFFVTSLAFLRRLVLMLIISFKPIRYLTVFIPGAGGLRKGKLSVLMRRLLISDWIFLEHLELNLDPPSFSRLRHMILTELSKQCSSTINDSNENFIV